MTPLRLATIFSAIFAFLAEIFFDGSQINALANLPLILLVGCLIWQAEGEGWMWVYFVVTGGLIDVVNMRTVGIYILPILAAFIIAKGIVQFTDYLGKEGDEIFLLIIFVLTYLFEAAIKVLRNVENTNIHVPSILLCVIFYSVFLYIYSVFIKSEPGDAYKKFAK